MLRSSLMLAAAASLAITGAIAQTPSQTAPASPPTTAQQVPAANGPSNPAVKTTEGNNAASPVAGANSFTEGQAKTRIESRGYTNVTGLKKDNNGVWRGTASKDGKTMEVSLDFQGNVIAR